MKPREKSPRLRPRVSLLNLLLLTATVALAIGLYQARENNARILARVGTLDAENKRLRAEQGALTIEDPKKIHAIQIADPRDDVWSFRVYLPPGHDYYLAGQANKLPMNGEPPRYGPGPPPGLSTTKSGVSDRGGVMTANGCSPGEHLISIALTRDDQGRKVFRATMTPRTPGSRGAHIGRHIPDVPGKWPDVELDPPDRTKPPIVHMERTTAANKQTTRSVDSGPLVLLEKRFMHSGAMNSADSDEGVLVWVGRADEHLQSDR